MVSTQGVVSHSRVPGMQSMLGAEGTPETGEFDFFNYLLGLQSGSDGNQQTEELFSTAIGHKADSASQEDPLLQIFQKKEDQPWNPMFPMGQIQTSPLQPTVKIEAKEAGKLDLVQDPKSSIENSDGAKRYSSKTENNFVSSADFLSLQKLTDKGNSDSRFGEDGTKLMNQSNQMSSMIQKYTSNEIQDDDKVSVQSYTKLAQAQQSQQISGSEVHTLQPQQHESLKIEGEATESKVGKSRDRQEDDSLFALTPQTHTKTVASPDQITAKDNAKETPRDSIPEVFKKVESMIHHGGGKMTVQLTPPDLGRVEIQVIARGKNVEIKMKSENDFAKAALESQVTELKHSMQGQDLMLHKVEVTTSKEWDNSQMGGMFSSFSQNPQQQTQSQGFSRENLRDQSSGHFGSTIRSSSSRSLAMQGSSGVQRSGMGSGRVDIRI